VELLRGLLEDVLKLGDRLVQHWMHSWAVSVLFGCIPSLIGKWFALPS
jgi:hypothetical protein